jgi:predicted Fe-Mo cluster-binding NifX family protein
MKVAVGTDDSILTSTHFGRSPRSLIFGLDGSEVRDKEMRTNTYTTHARGRCHKDGHEDQPLSHEPIIEALRDCEAAVCGGMGWRAANEISAQGIQPFVIVQ